MPSSIKTKSSIIRYEPAVLQQKIATHRKYRGSEFFSRYDHATLERIDVEYVPIGLLKPNSWNPNRMSEQEFELLLRSIEEDGFTQPILVNKDNVIIDGEHRWRASNTLGMIEVPVIRSAMGDIQMRISTIRHNIARGSNDVDMENAIYHDVISLGGIDWLKSSLNLDDIEFDLDLAPIEHVLSTPEVVPPVQPPPIPIKPLPSAEINTNSIPEFENFMTEQAQRLQQMREELLPRAASKEEREKIKQDMVIYRLSLAFSGDEALLIRDVLQGNSAEIVLAMCQEAIAQEGEN